MQRKIIHGVPYYTDKINIFLWDEQTSQIGTCVNDTITYKPGIIESLAPRLSEWRAAQTSRIRKPTSRKNTGNKAAASEVFEDDE
jgi:hypothetical protein